MNRNQTIAIVIGAILIFAGYACITAEKDKLSVTVGGTIIKDPLLPAEVFGHVEDVEYSNSKDAFIVSPSQQLTINVAAYNDQQYSLGFYKVWVYDDYRIIWSSPEVMLWPNDIKEWTFTYTATSYESTTTIYVESGVKFYEDDTLYSFDDMDYFNIVVEEDAPTDPCEGISCTSKCVGETYYYSGYCTDGICEYSTAKVDGKCGYTDPVSDPCEGTTCPDVCVEPYTFKCNGVCVNGECEYVEQANSEQCGYVSPTEEPTVEPTETPTGTETPTATPPTNGEPEENGIPTLYYIVGILAISGAVALYLIGSKR